MNSESFKKTSIFLMLGLLTVSAFFVRLENFKQSRLRTIDEIVYYRMAKQVLDEGFSGYHTMAYGKEMSDAGRPLPDYFFQPLFKHPPVFTFLIAASMSILGVNMAAAGIIPIALSVFMIPLLYFLGAEIYGKRVGILAAIFLWIDPINIISSQKIWMDTTIAFFVLLAALFFVMGLKRSNDWWFIFSGLASGLAVNTKYTGIFVVLIIVAYCLLHRRDLFTHKKFQFSLLLPFLLLLPWFYWNYQVYGFASVLQHREIQLIIAKLTVYTPAILLLTALLFLLVFILRRNQRKVSSDQNDDMKAKQGSIEYLSILIPVVFFLLIVPQQLLHSLQFTYLPTHSWQQGIFFGASPLFYFGRLIEFSPIYIFSFVAILLYHPVEKKEAPFIRLCAMTILIFFIFWGNYQSRYILSSLPFFILLGTQWLENFYCQVSSSHKAIVYYGGRIMTWIILVFSISKINYINFMISYPNDMCYF